MRRSGKWFCHVLVQEKRARGLSVAGLVLLTSTHPGFYRAINTHKYQGEHAINRFELFNSTFLNLFAPLCSGRMSGRPELRESVFHQELAHGFETVRSREPKQVIAALQRAHIQGLFA